MGFRISLQKNKKINLIDRVKNYTARHEHKEHHIVFFQESKIETPDYKYSVTLNEIFRCALYFFLFV